MTQPHQPPARPVPPISEAQRYVNRGVNTLNELRKLGTPPNLAPSEWEANLSSCQSLLHGILKRGEAARAYLISHVTPGNGSVSFLASHILECEPKDSPLNAEATGPFAFQLDPSRQAPVTPLTRYLAVNVGENGVVVPLGEATSDVLYAARLVLDVIDNDLCEEDVPTWGEAYREAYRSCSSAPDLQQAQQLWQIAGGHFGPACYAETFESTLSVLRFELKE